MQLARVITESAIFRGGIVGVILLAGVLAGLETSGAMVARHGEWMRALDGWILGIFTVEILLKLVAEGRRPWRYFRDGWNVFDFVVVGLCYLPSAGGLGAVLRLARVLRVLRLVSVLPKLQLLVGALLRSLSAMGYVSLLLALLFYIYAVAGVHLFGGNGSVDFGSLPIALLTLFRVVTLDNWGDVFNRALEGSSAIAVTLYFVTFIVFGTMIILNLFIGIIMNSMAEAHAEQAGSGGPGQGGEAGARAGESEWQAQLEEVTRRVQELQGAVAGLRRSIEGAGVGGVGRRGVDPSGRRGEVGEATASSAGLSPVRA